MLTGLCAKQVCRAKRQTQMIRNAAYPILKFNETVVAIANEIIPKTSTNPKHPCKPWFHDDCKDAIRKGRTTVRKTSYIGQSPHLQSERSKKVKRKSSHFLS